MSPRLVPAGSDSTGRRDRPLRITVDGEPADGIEGQTLAGVLLASGRTAWRTGPSGAARGVFCGIGVCFDCLVTVNEDPDVRACRRRAVDGDVVRTQSRAHPGTTGPQSDTESGHDSDPDPGHARNPGHGSGSRSEARAEGEK
ncbi:2Fe-2S iron-sulfur cluster-binding protein [Streptomyces sp. 891-h]|uniref:(2Fe-2S)-binding protein n=1 Tax=Streptomyces sp. 891-h TaxID=2720714 RepID=UPI001FAA22A1|nr:2Fe-2S iron-sulfur cluster-binding protein [Streptomyces sp. 891-h]UNZ19867.1 (2Fe-2S)-binding protein [Streptomyces sp. 891-h]